MLEPRLVVAETRYFHYLIGPSVKTIFFSLAFFFAANAAEVKRIVLPSGGLGYSIRCDNDGMNSCYEAAGETCHHGYTVENQNMQSGFVSEQSSYVGPGVLKGTVQGGSSGTAYSTSDNGLLVQCKDPEQMETERQQRLQAQREAVEARDRHQAKVILFYCAAMSAAILTGLLISLAVR